MTDVLVRAEGVCKEFSGVRVLDAVNVDIVRGEILGIIGENGAGKSTFVKILGGVYAPTTGRFVLDGQPVEVRSPAAAKRIGISLIPQEFNLIRDLTVYENIFLGNELQRRGGLLDKPAMRRRARELLQALETSIDPDAKVDRLSAAQKQMVEIAKALVHESRLLILDEPTTVLTGHETDILFGLMRRLKARGVTILYISHKLREVKTVCDRVMILRDGKLISLTPAAELDEHEMARRMVGRELSQVYPPRTAPGAEVALRIEGLAVEGLLADISFDLRRGEILGFAGLVGAGRTELAEALIGIRRRSAGRIFARGREVAIRSIQDAMRHGIAYLSEDRQGAGILLRFDITANVTLASLRAYSRGLLRHGAARRRAQEYVERFGIRAASLATRLEFFSGGNQQKVSLAKSLDPGPDIFIFDEPTRGIDVNAKREIYFFMNELVRSGVACMLISSEMEEIVGLCNRVVVMRQGRVTGVLEGSHINEEEIIYHATGLKGAA